MGHFINNNFMFMGTLHANLRKTIKISKLQLTLAL